MEQVTGGASHGRSASGGFDSGLDIGAYFDRIGLEREQSAALERLLAATDHGPGQAQKGETDVERLRALLEGLDDPTSNEPTCDDPTSDGSNAVERVDPIPALHAPVSNATAASADAGAVSVVLREALEVLSEEGPLPRHTTAVQVGGRVVALLDDVTSAHLIAAAGASGAAEGSGDDPALADALTGALGSRRF